MVEAGTSTWCSATSGPRALLVEGDRGAHQKIVRRNVTIDWTRREKVRANLRRLVKPGLRKHGYPPDKREKATRTVMEQAEVLSAG